MTNVVSALIAHPKFQKGSIWTERYLLCQRGEDSSFPFWWETPGGKVESGETFEKALRREISEELGLTTVTVDDGSIFTYNYERYDYSVHFFPCVVAGQIKIQEHAGLGWMTVGEVIDNPMNFTPATLAFMEYRRIQLVTERDGLIADRSPNVPG